MSSSGACPPPIPEVSADLKFDGGVKVGWAPVRRRIINSLKTQGLLGYTDGSIIKPTPNPVPQASSPSTSTTVTPTTGTPTPTPTPTSAPEPKATAVFSLKPSPEEWLFQNDRAKGIVESHIYHLPSLIPDVDDKSAKEPFEILDAEFSKKDGMCKVLTDRRLRSLIFRETESIDEFFNQLREVRLTAMEAGNNINDKIFREIVITAFPTLAFDSIIQNITANESQYPTAASVIQQITFQYSQVKHRPDAVVSGDKIAQAHTAMSSQAALLLRIEKLEGLAAKNARSGNSDKKCHNCGRTGHLKDDCFRKGGGKEGQYLTWWRGKKDTDLPLSGSPLSSMAITELTQHYGMAANLDDAPGELFADSGASDHFF